jgi:phosphoribosylamine--glycine ligase
MLNVLVLGDDGRTHALVWKLFNSPLASEVLCAPGNGGIAQLVPQVDMQSEDVSELAQWAFSEHIDIIVPASSKPLRDGLADELLTLSIGGCGPPRSSARLEQSRCYAKEFLLRHRLPTAPGKTFDNLSMAEKYLAAQTLPVVLKADHPDAGDGIFQDRYTALAALRDFFEARPVEGSNEGVVIESFLPGVRVSLSAFTDGQTVRSLLTTRIYDRLKDGDAGPAAPAMGAHTSNSTYAQKLTNYLHHHLLVPLVQSLARDALPYWGILGIDCIVTERGPRITALRCSLRDMEAQVVLPRMEDDLLAIVQALITHRLEEVPPLRWRDEASVGITLVAEGYPHHFPMGSPITGLNDVDEGVMLFHHETENPFGLKYTPAALRNSLNPLSNLMMGGRVSTSMTTSGGHVLTVVALGVTLSGARGRAIINADRIQFAGRFYREDIGQHEFK